VQAMIPQLVIFDCDGVLVDSEILAAEVLGGAMTALGMTTTREDAIRLYTGLSKATIAREAFVRHGKTLPDGFFDRCEPERIALFNQRLRAVEGIADLLDTLQMRKCVASSSSPERIEHSLGLTGLWDRLHPHIFSATMVKNGKPAPDLFLHAAKKMGVTPDRCVVIEDSIPGVRAGVAAGMEVWGFTGGSHCAPNHADILLNAGAARCFAHMSDIRLVFDNAVNVLRAGGEKYAL
jgi:HAD superfamily hydrolase (TIGR01509 family)